MSRPNDESLSELKWIVGVLGGAGLLWLLTGWFMGWNDRRIDETARSRLVFAHRVRLADERPALLLVEEVLHSGGDFPDTTAGRLDVVDPTSGKRLARAIQVTARDCQPAGAGRVWCDDRDPNPPEDRGLVLRELASLGVVASHAQLKQAVPAYAKGIAKSGASVYVEPDSGAVVAPMNDGTTWRIDPAECPACRAGEVQAGSRYALSWRFGSSQYGTVSSARVGERDLVFTAGPRQALAVRSGTGATPLGALTFLDAGLLADTDTADKDPLRPVVLEGDGLVLVHKDTLDTSVAKTQLTAVDPSGAARWSAEVGRGTVLGAWRFRSDGLDALVLAIEADQSWLVALDPASGRVLWRYEIQGAGMPVIQQFQTWRLELFVPIFEALQRRDLEELAIFVEALPDPVPPSRRRAHRERARKLEQLHAPAILVEHERYLTDRQAWLRAHLGEEGAAESVLELAQGPRALRMKELLAVRWLLDPDYRAAIEGGVPFARTYSPIDQAVFGSSALEIDGVRPFPKVWESLPPDNSLRIDHLPGALFHWHEPPALEEAARLLERARDAKAPSFATFKRTYAGASTYFSFCDVVTEPMLKSAYPRLVAAARRDALRLAAFYRWAAARGLCVDVSEVSE